MNTILNFFKNESGSTLVEFFKTLIVTIIFLLVAMAIVKAVFRKIEKNAAKRGHDVGSLRIIRYIILGLIYIASLTAVLKAIPAFTSFISTLLAGSGVMAIVLTVAAQEPIGNLVSGLLIAFTKPFKVGDTIRYVDQNITGIVEEITLRHTVIRTFENKRLIIPNNTFNTCTIENSTYSEEKICMHLEFTITYESDAVTAMQIVSDVVLMHPDYLDIRTQEDITNGLPPVRTAVMRFDPSAVVIRAWVWAADTDTSISMRSDILLGVQMRFKQAGIDFAYPHTVVVPK